MFIGYMNGGVEDIYRKGLLFFIPEYLTDTTVL